MRACGMLLVCGCACTAMGQVGGLGAAGAILARAQAERPGGGAHVRAPIVASLSYDGVNTYGYAGQDFESVFDIYDIFCCEPFSIDSDAMLSEFRSTGFGNGNPFGATDFVCEIYHAADKADLCDDDALPRPVAVSTPGVGFFDGTDGVTDFGDQCLEASEYILRWAVELNFGTYGQIFFFGQFGEHDNGGGAALDGFQSNPGNGFDLGRCFGCTDFGCLGVGINFVLCGDDTVCDDACPDALGCGDWDNDGDADGDDFFGFLDSFATADPCADLDEDGDIDGDDFFAFLDRFVRTC